MKINQLISKYFTNHAETNEEHWNEHLQTHYFKMTKDKAFQAVNELYSKSHSFDVIAKSAEHGEISLHTKGRKKAFIVISIVMVKPFHTAIDFSVTTESSIPFDFGYSHKIIEKQYKLLKRELPFLDTSLAEKIQT